MWVGGAGILRPVADYSNTCWQQQCDVMSHTLCVNWVEPYKQAGGSNSSSLVPRPFPPPVYISSLRSDEIYTGGGNGLGTRLHDQGIILKSISFPHPFVVRLSVVTTQCMITERGGTYMQNSNHELQGLTNRMNYTKSCMSTGQVQQMVSGQTPSASS